MYFINRVCNIDKFCAVSQDSTITLWDGRVNNGRSTIYLPYQISNAHGKYNYILFNFIINIIIRYNLKIK